MYHANLIFFHYSNDIDTPFPGEDSSFLPLSSAYTRVAPNSPSVTYKPIPGP